MENCISQLKKEFASVRTGRANPNILARVQVDYYGALTPLKQLATVTVQEGTTLCIAPFDKNLIKDIEKALIKGDIGVTPNNDGAAIRLNFPPLTEERRREIAKDVKKYGEEAKVMVRNVRRDMTDSLKKLEKEENLDYVTNHVRENKQHKKICNDLGIKEIEDMCFSILSFHSTPGDISKELVKEKEKDVNPLILIQ